MLKKVRKLIGDRRVVGGLLLALQVAFMIWLICFISQRAVLHQRHHGGLADP